MRAAAIGVAVELGAAYSDAGADELVGGGAADAEELGGLLDGDGQGLDVLVVHASLGR